MLTRLKLVKKLPAFLLTRRFITAFARASQVSLSWASSIQSILPHPTYRRAILILSCHLRLGIHSVLFPSCFPTKTVNTPLPSPYVLNASSNTFFSILSPAQNWVSSAEHQAPHYVVFSIPCYLAPLKSKMLFPQISKISTMNARFVALLFASLAVTRPLRQNSSPRRWADVMSECDNSRT